MEKRTLVISLFVLLAFVQTAKSEQQIANSKNKLQVVVAKIANVFSGPSKSSSIVGQVKNGQVVNYVSTEGLWTKIGDMAYIPSVAALPKDRVEIVDGVAKGKSLNEINSLVSPVYQTTNTEVKVKNPDGTVSSHIQTTVTHLEHPVASPTNTNVGVMKDGNSLPIVDDTILTTHADRTHPNRVSTTTAMNTLEYNRANPYSNAVLGIARNNHFDTSTAVNSVAGKTLMGVLEAKPVDNSQLKGYQAKHIKSKTVVDSLNNIDAVYDTESTTDTVYTADEFVKRYYQGTKKLDVVFTSTGKPATGFTLTFSPRVGDIATSKGAQRGIVKQIGNGVVVLIEQNYKWADKHKTGFYAAKNRRLTVTNGIGIDSKGTRYVFYTPSA